MKKLNDFQTVGCNDVAKHCIVCPLAKQSRLPFPLSTIVSGSCFYIIHGEVWGPYRVPTYDGKRYFPTLVNDHSWYTWVFLLPTKAEVIVSLKSFFFMVKNVYPSSF